MAAGRIRGIVTEDKEEGSEYKHADTYSHQRKLDEPEAENINSV